MREQRHVVRKFRRLGTSVIIKIGKNSNLVKSTHGSNIKNNGPIFTTYTTKPDISPGEKKLSAIGFNFQTKIIAITPALDWIDQGFDLTILDKEVNDVQFQLGNQKYNLSQIKPIGFVKGNFLYVLIGGV